MVLGYVLISTAPTKEREVYDAIMKIKEIVEAHPLFGEYDIIAKIETDDFTKMGAVVIDKIRTVKGVIDTKTLSGITMS
jgi:DNA-binding Lrp family transcriptional regulator